MGALDHLVVAAADLAGGRRWVEERLGVAMEDGGRHLVFGTHNALLSLGPDHYLEVIAIDPEAPPPDRPRWFELDTEAMRERLAAGPQLVHWVVRVGSADEVADPVQLSRGSNRWVIGVPADARMPHGGLAPTRILWHTPRPSELLPDKGIRLDALTISTHDVAALRTVTGEVKGPIRVTEGDPGLAATFRTPRGSVTFGPP
jgi:hypothetical protein